VTLKLLKKIELTKQMFSQLSMAETTILLNIYYNTIIYVYWGNFYLSKLTQFACDRQNILYLFYFIVFFSELISGFRWDSGFSLPKQWIWTKAEWRSFQSDSRTLKWQYLNELQAVIIHFKALPSHTKGIFEYAVAYLMANLFHRCFSRHP